MSRCKNVACACTGACREPIPPVNTFEQFCYEHNVSENERAELIKHLAAFRMGKTLELFNKTIPSDLQSRINIWSMRPQPNTPQGDAWEQGCYQGYEWGKQDATTPQPSTSNKAG